MTDPAAEIPETTLQNCAAAAPRPWFPAVYARDNGVVRDVLDSKVDWLRMGGLIRIADWVQGQGQGYTLTPEGKQVLESPRELDRLRKGQMPAPASAKAEELRHAEPRGSAWERGEVVRDALVFRREPLVTRFLLFLNAAVFMAGLILAVQRHIPAGVYLYGFSNDPQQRMQMFDILQDCGALTGQDILNGQWWRLLTCCFVHFGLMHFGLNMVSLLVVGGVEETMWGRLRYLILYLISGVCGSCAMVIRHPEGVGAGASGAIWGLMAGLVAWVFLNRRYIGHGASQWLRRLMFVVVLNAALSFLPQISAAAHFAGGAAGLIAAVLLNEERFARSLRRGLAIAGLLALPVIGVGAVLYAQKIDPRWMEVRRAQSHKDWVLKWRPPIEDLWLKAMRIELEQVVPLYDSKRGGLKPGSLDKLTATSNEMRPMLEEGIRELYKVPPLSDEADERQHLDYLNQFEKALKVLELRQARAESKEAEERQANVPRGGASADSPGTKKKKN